MFVDTHCHIHEADFPGGGEAALERAREAGVEKLICVGTDEKTSKEAVEFASKHENVWSSVGLHPHDAKSGITAIKDLQKIFDNNASSKSRSSFSKKEYALSGFSEATFVAERIPFLERGEEVTGNKIVAIGECGLDYFYNNSPKKQQFDMLHAQIELAQKYNLPMIFHVREAFIDFWPIFDQYQGIRGVLHSFTDTQANLDKAMERELYIGVNGISTFTKIEAQREVFRRAPLERIILETDAPFLTPVPKRGTINEPAFVTLVADFLANLRSISLRELSRATSQNASDLFLI
jgi:TatD DNase family protein